VLRRALLDCDRPGTIKVRTLASPQQLTSLCLLLVSLLGVFPSGYFRRLLDTARSCCHNRSATPFGGVGSDGCGSGLRELSLLLRLPSAARDCGAVFSWRLRLILVRGWVRRGGLRVAVCGEKGPGKRLQQVLGSGLANTVFARQAFDADVAGVIDGVAGGTWFLRVSSILPPIHRTRMPAVIRWLTLLCTRWHTHPPTLIFPVHDFLFLFLYCRS
jgi:hypothetical protein